MRSFIPTPDEHPFPLQNLPYGVVRKLGSASSGHCVARIGDWVVDLRKIEEAGLLRGLSYPGRLFERSRLNELMSQESAIWSAVRKRLTELLLADNRTLRDDEALRSTAMAPIDQVEPLMPVEIGDYTDFYSSRQHAYNVGCMFRDPAKALMPNWLWLPVGYHGRASSIVVSGTPVRRPCGQLNSDETQPPTFGPSRALDFELEVGVFFGGKPNPLGEPISLAAAEEHLFGLVLVNDWSARDIQRWEYQPLGPFLSKNFATTISPWIVPLEALRPCRVPPPAQDPAPLPYLTRRVASDEPAAGWSYDIPLEVAIQPRAGADTVISRSNFRHLYWTIAQQLAHHTVTGCNMRPGDLLASGTISGPTPDSYGSMLELAWKGTKPLTLADGSQRKFIEDRDCVTLRAEARAGAHRIGFGECRGEILPARNG